MKSNMKTFITINMYFRLRFGLANAINVYSRLKLVLCGGLGGIFNRAFIKFVIKILV